MPSASQVRTVLRGMPARREAAATESPSARKARTSSRSWRGLVFDRKPAREAPWTRALWIYDYRTNVHHTLKQNPLRYEHLAEFVASFSAEDRNMREESERFRRFIYEELLQRDKVSLDITWLRDESLEDGDNLPPPEVIAQEIVEDVEAALAEFAQIANALASPATNEPPGQV